MSRHQCHQQQEMQYATPSNSSRSARAHLYIPQQLWTLLVEHASSHLQPPASTMCILDCCHDPQHHIGQLHLQLTHTTHQFVHSVQVATPPLLTAFNTGASIASNINNTNAMSSNVGLCRSTYAVDVNEVIKKSAENTDMQAEPATIEVW